MVVDYLKSTCFMIKNEYRKFYASFFLHVFLIKSYIHIIY